MTFYFFCVWMLCPHVYVSVPLSCLVLPDARKEHWIPLELELQMVVKCRVGVGRAAFNHRAISPAMVMSDFKDHCLSC